jgi:hypothetical protein
MTTDELIATERRRLRALVAVDAAVLDELHDPGFRLINPGGGEWSREDYLGGVLSDRIDYRRFDAVSPIAVLQDGGLAVLRYRSAIGIAVAGQPPGPLSAWHLDCYRRDQAGRWRVLWSQATEIKG